MTIRPVCARGHVRDVPDEACAGLLGYIDTRGKEGRLSQTRGENVGQDDVAGDVGPSILERKRVGHGRLTWPRRKKRSSPQLSDP